MTFTRAIGRDDAGYAIEATGDLGTWIPAVQVGLPTYNAGGTETLTYRHPQVMTGEAQQFLRLRIALLP
jgi:hypothetical protein